jgi:hypothetical protein
MELSIDENLSNRVKITKLNISGEKDKRSEISLESETFHKNGKKYMGYMKVRKI